MPAERRTAVMVMLVCAVLAGAAGAAAAGVVGSAGGPAGASQRGATSAGATRATPAVNAAAARAKTITKTTTRSTTATTPTVSSFYISGAGFGHGVGMSQYGAAGFAAHGYRFSQILSHYYTGTTLGKVMPSRNVTVLVHEGAAIFSGVSAIVGSPKKLNPMLNYGVTPHGSQLRVTVGHHLVGTFAAPTIVRAKGSAPVTLDGQGAYDGTFQFRPDGKGGVMTVNSVPLEDYVRGVVPAEMPSTWPAQALEAQAVAARTYAVSSSPANADFDLYDDTRSQMYGGIRAQTVTGNAAVAATSGLVVEYYGRPVVTYFFSSSGGYTESVQNVWYGAAPEPWLRGVPDPYDDIYANPYYRWIDSYTLAAAAQKLRELYQGTLEGIKITRRGVSPRVVQAQVVGTGGESTVSGLLLQRLFGTRSTYMSFTTLSELGERTAKTVFKTTVSPTRTTTGTTPTAPVVTTPTNTMTTTATTPTTTTTGSTSTATSTATATITSGVAATTHKSASTGERRSKVTKTTTTHLSLQGTVYPAKQGQIVTAQLATDEGWRSVAHSRLAASGRYTIPVKIPATYRVVYQRLDGPDVRVP